MGNRGIFGTQSNIYDEAFQQKKLTAKVVNCFCKKASLQTFGWVLNTACGNTVKKQPFKTDILPVMLGSKYSSWQYCQKNSQLKLTCPQLCWVLNTACGDAVKKQPFKTDIPPVMLNILHLYSYCGYFILSHKSEKHAREMKE